MPMFSANWIASANQCPALNPLARLNVLLNETSRTYDHNNNGGYVFQKILHKYFRLDFIASNKWSTYGYFIAIFGNVP